MNEIENAQRELCEFLISMMPVEWSKICLYSECSTGYCSYWLLLLRKKQGRFAHKNHLGKDIIRIRKYKSSICING